MEVLAPLTNDPIMSSRSIQSFRHLKHQNLSTGDVFMDGSGIFFLVPFWPPRRHWHHLPMILSCRGDQYGCLDTLNVKIRR